MSSVDNAALSSQSADYGQTSPQNQSYNFEQPSSALLLLFLAAVGQIIRTIIARLISTLGKTSSNNLSVLLVPAGKSELVMLPYLHLFYNEK